MKTAKPKKKNYTPRPTIEPEVMQRLAVISRLMCGEINVTEASAELGLSRNHFQTIYHRSLGAMIEELTPKTAGRPSKDPFVAALEDEAISLRAEVKRLTTQLEVSHRATMGLAEIVREQSSIGRARSPKTKPQKKATEKTSDDDDDRRGLLIQARNLVSVGVPAPVAAQAVATPATTLRRWAARDRAGEQLARRRGPSSSPLPSATSMAAGEERVRRVRGHIGCAALGKAVGLSRRTAVLVKEQTLIAMERERKASAARVRVTTAGVVRGFDQMYVATLSGWRFALISADAAVPFRTSAIVAEHYLSDDVEQALEHDIELNGAPLVVRLDRAAVHRTPDVTKMLEGNGVLVLHGPPHCPQYYGQLERQNREHRAWLDDVELRDTADLEAELGDMFRCLNELIPRRSLGWCTPSDIWNQRPKLDVDRDAFRDEVRERAARIAPSLGDRERRLGFDQRFAIEHTLKRYGYLETNNEERC